MSWKIRRATVEDLPAIAALDERGFGFHYQPGELDDFAKLYEPERFLLASDPSEGADIGVTGSFTFAVTAPGGAALPAQGLSWVSVAATHRRRGVLRALLEEQHRGFVVEGVPLAVLTASEGGIYGRFGYRPAGRERTVLLDRRFCRFRADVPDPGGVRMVGTGQARELAPDVHRRWAARTPGAISRNERWWDALLRDRPRQREGESGLFHLIHPDGYASYRVTPPSRDDFAARTCRVIDFFAVTDEAHLALWRVLLALDLIATVRTEHCPLDDPLPYLLTDPRQVRTSALGDGLWARILDVPAVLSARRYPVEVDTVLEVGDDFLGVGGRFRLRGGPDGARCEPVATATAEARLDIGPLAQLVFGSVRPATLARAGLLAADPAVCRRLDSAFATEREVVYGTHF